MRSSVILGFVGKFLEIFSVLVALPLLISIYFGEPLLVKAGFMVASASSLVMGIALKFQAGKYDPTPSEAMFATVLGWVLAVMLGSIPLVGEMAIVNAVFESAAGLTTTGISMFLEPSTLPRSLLFWRSFMQWIGGLGILTFFIAVIRETGGTSRKLFSAEAHKTDSGSIRPSLTKSIFALWKVYAVITAVIIMTYLALGMSSFNAFLHAFSAISTGGFSTTAASIGGFSQAVQGATVFFMFIGGVNFVLLYKFLRLDFSPVLKNSEFRLYTQVFLLVSLLAGIELVFNGSPFLNAILDSTFQSAAVISSTGYSTMSIASFSTVLQALFIGVMFMGGSLGSTSGGLKVFRVKTLIELLRARLRAYRLPESAVNEVKIDGEIMERSTVRTISALLFAWVSATFLITLVTLFFEPVSLMGALSGAVSSIGNMGPVYFSGEKMVSMHVVTKMVWVIGMLAGRLEMLPLLAIFNSGAIKDTS